MTRLLAPFNLLSCAGSTLWLGVLAGEGRLACGSWADRRCPDRAQLAIVEVMSWQEDWQLGVGCAVPGPVEVQAMGRRRGKYLDGRS